MKAKELVGQIFGKLTVLERAPNPLKIKNSTDAYWKCQCSCGNIHIVRSYALTIGHTTSCGCKKKYESHFIDYNKPKYKDPQESIARGIWSSRIYNKELPFNDFFILCKKNCYYCNSIPNIKKISNRKNKNEFYFNSLDRIDSSLSHTTNNVVPCCITCNMAKLNRSLEDFFKYKENIKNHIRISIDEYREKSSEKNISFFNDDEKYSLISSIKRVYSRYNDGNLTLEKFYQLSQMNCYYCNSIPGNKKNNAGKNSSNFAKITGDFIYNGLDRVDNNLPHNYENVVPCCKYCNSAKNTSILAEFLEWIERFSNYKII